MDSIHLESVEIYSILSAIFWLVMGVVIMRYASRIRMEKDQNMGKALSFWGLVMFVNAALVVYIPDLLLAWIISILTFVISILVVFFIKHKQKKCK